MRRIGLLLGCIFLAAPLVANQSLGGQPILINGNNAIGTFELPDPVAECSPTPFSPFVNASLESELIIADRAGRFARESIDDVGFFSILIVIYGARVFDYYSNVLRIAGEDQTTPTHQCCLARSYDWRPVLDNLARLIMDYRLLVADGVNRYGTEISDLPAIQLYETLLTLTEMETNIIDVLVQLDCLGGTIP